MAKTKISNEEYKKVEAEALAAQEILEDPRFEFFRIYLENGLKSVEESILNNTVREYQEVVSITDRITRIFRTSKKLQIDELAGQYKFITKLKNDLKYFSNLKTQLDSDISKRLVLVEEDAGKDVTG